MNPFKRFLLTLSYVTALPLKKLAAQIASSEGADDENSLLAGLAKFLPSAGLLIGLILSAIAYLLLFKTHAPHAVVGAILATIWLCLTGGLHFDGLMDTADGVFSHRSRERMLEIMLDSRVGNFGAMAGMSIFILKCVSLISICSCPKVLLSLLVIAPAWARWCELYAIGRYPYAKEEGKGKIWHVSTRVPNDFFTGMAPAIIITGLLAGFTGMESALAMVAFTLVSGLVAARWLASRLGGHTGDTYGAVVELAETGCLLLSASLLR